MKIKLVLLSVFFISFLGISQSVKLDKKLGKENAISVEQTMGIYKNVKMTNYLRSVGNRLVSNLNEPLFEYHFNIVPDKSPNAFALPGGYIYITTGLLPLLASEDELACILGHEIIHSNNRHAVQQLKKKILPSLLEIPGELLGVVNNNLGAIFNAPIQVSNKLLFASYGRKFETEADDEGTKLAAKTGYEPKAIISALSRLSKTIEVATDNKEKKSYFNDHPYTPKRTASIEEITASLSWEKAKPITQNFLYEFDNVLFGDNPNQGVIIDNKFLHPDLDFFIEFPVGWTIDNETTNVGGYQPENKAAAFVYIEKNNISPQKAGKSFADNLSNKDKSKMTGMESYILNGKKGYLLTFEETVKSQTVFAYILWVNFNEKLFKLIGVGPSEYKDTLENISSSLRVLNHKDKATIKISKVRVVKAKQGETITSLSKRVDNKLSIELTGVINSVAKNKQLHKGTLIKVVKEQNYYLK
jgi:predicted Zn-dependent protease